MKKEQERNEQLRTLLKTLTKALTIECRMRGFELCQADQDDLVQEVLIQMWRVDLSRFNPEKSSLTTYAKRRLRWMLIDFMRAKSKISTPRYFSNIDELADVYLPPALDPEQVLENAEMEKMLLNIPQLIDKALAELSEQQIEAVFVPLIAGKKLQDVAEKFDVHPSTITREAHRGLAMVHQKCVDEKVVKMPFYAKDWMHLA